MQKVIAILFSLVIVLTISYSLLSCNKNKCYHCYFYYQGGSYYNPTTNDTIGLSLVSKNHGLDTLEKYIVLGYIHTGVGASSWEQDYLCDEDLLKLSNRGINYNCDLNKR